MASQVVLVAEWGQSETFDGVPLTQVQNFHVSTTNVSATVEAVTLTQVQDLEAEDTVVSTTVAAPMLVQDHALAVAAGTTVEATVPSLPFVQHHIFAVPVTVSSGEASTVTAEFAHLASTPDWIVQTRIPLLPLRQHHRFAGVVAATSKPKHTALRIQPDRIARRKRQSLSGETVVYSMQGDTLDLLIWRYVGRTADIVEAALDANPGLSSKGDVLPIGTPVTIPRVVTEAAPKKKYVRLWE